MSRHNWNDPSEAKQWDQNHAGLHNPLRAEQLDILLSVIEASFQPNQWLLDLGMGSGLVEEQLFKRIPEARVVGVDSSTEMLKLAHERLRPYANRYETHVGDFADLDQLPLPDYSYQCVFSVQALHHLTPAQMKRAYSAICDRLQPGGLFLLLDRIKVPSPLLWPLYQTLWQRQDRVYRSQVAPHEGETFVEHQAIVSGRGDLPVTLDEHLAWLNEAGFVATCLHLHGNRALFAARKASVRSMGEKA
ncbi:class I SAM-dependent methyltransferase [Laceyella putida]|uniref:Class I SAM-dependent methyltransferase n=1 Tax=Laceyella putida TaxID=110101 RepID=A0ABW2RKU0_9BACL